MVGQILSIKLIIMIHFYGQLGLFLINLEMYVHGIKQMLLLTLIWLISKMQQIILILSPITIQLLKNILVELVCTILETMMELINHLLPS